MSDRIDQLITLGREHYKAGEYDKAEPLLAEAVGLRPRLADVSNMLGVIYHAQGRFQDAEAAFEAALAINPNYTEAALNLSVTYNDRGKYDRARDIYTRVVTNSATAPRALDPFARGKLANMHADLGAAYASVAMYDEAVREYQAALGLCPEFADLRTRLGAVLRDAGDIDGAIRELSAARDQRPEYMAARVQLGLAYFSAGRKDEAVATWRDVLTRDPGNKNAALYLRMMKE
jgi:tetratricopeptide (TPR) repeat protein